MQIEEKKPVEGEISTKAQAKKASEDYFADFDFADLKINLDAMLKAGVHFGHQNARKNPKMDQYIFTTRKGINILDLQKTSEKMEEALEFLKEIKKSGKQILFVGTKKQLHDIVKSAAKRTGMPYVIDRWLGGTFTNFKNIRGRAKYLKENSEKLQKGEFGMYTKLERLKKGEELEKMERKMGGIVDMAELPGAVVVTDTKEDGLAIKEAVKKGISVVAIVDTNNNPVEVDYPIPANDDAVSSVRLILAYICKVIIE
jgi:small subunit ribosomal protein S2